MINGWKTVGPVIQQNKIVTGTFVFIKVKQHLPLSLNYVKPAQ
jgi:hypothetical protein